MTIAARWIRLELGGTRALRAAATGFAREQGRRAAPAVLWTPDGAGRCACALVVPLKHAPGRAQRWPAWAMAPLVAAYRERGLRAYLENGAIRLSGTSIAAGEAVVAGECALVMIQLLLRQTGFMEALRKRIEAQHGWQFDHAWPDEAERAAIDEALAVEALDAQ